MKKFLSLVLALVMTMSLVTVSAGAADFTDDSKITYKEAVDVMTALGVVGGYTDGSFNPNGTLTRGAAAKIICNLMLGTTTAEALVASSAPYSDVPTDNVFAGYIAYLAKEGVVGGYADGTFKPAATLTGYAFMKMLLGVLGLDAEVEGYNEANWSIAVAKRALSESVDLTDGLVGDFNGTKAVTREEACLYAFNMLKAGKFSYETSSTIVVGNVTVKNNSKAEQTTVKNINEDSYYAGVFTNLKYASGKSDDFGRTAHTWTLKNTKIGTYADAADYTFVATDVASDKDGFLKVIQDELDNDDLKMASSVSLKVNGDSKTWSAGKIEKGDVVEVYTNADDEDVIEKLVTMRYTVEKITDVSTKLTKAQKDDGATCKISTASVKNLTDDKIEGFDANTYVEDAYLLYILMDGEIVASQIAESVEGKVTAKKSSDVKIDGTYYESLLTGNDALGIGDEGTYYLNLAGQIVAFEGTSKTSDNYAFIYRVNCETKANNDGIDDSIYTAYFVKADGTKASAVLEDVTDLGLTNDGESKTNIGMVKAYSINSDGEFVVEDAKDDIYRMGNNVSFSKTSATISGTEGTVYASDETVYIFVDMSNSTKVTVKTVTGYKNAKVETGTYVHTVSDDGDALFVFVKAANVAQTSDANLAVLLNATPVEEENEDEDAIYTYEVAIDGDETTLTFESAALAGKDKGYVFAYEMEDGYAKLDATEQANIKAMAKVTKATSSYAVIGSQYAITDDTTVYTVTVEYKDSENVDVDDDSFNPTATGMSAKIDSVEVSEGGSISKDDYVVYTLDGTDLDVVFVYEFIG